MKAEKAVFALLSLSSGISAIVGQRVFLIAAAEETPAPLLVFRKTSAQRSTQISAGTQLVSAQIEVLCIATTGQELLELAEQVRLALLDQSGTFGGTEVIDVRDADEGPQEYEPTLREFAQTWTFTLDFEE